MTEPLHEIRPAQRLQVELQSHASGKRVAIRVEAYDPGLGWYSSGSMTLPLAQLPLLEQAIAEMRTVQAREAEGGAEIIPFPGMAFDLPTAAGAES